MTNDKEDGRMRQAAQALTPSPSDVGARVGGDGAFVGALDGASVGAWLGGSVGSRVGALLGGSVGARLGALENKPRADVCVRSAEGYHECHDQRERKQCASINQSINQPINRAAQRAALPKEQSDGHARETR